MSGGKGADWIGWALQFIVGAVAGILFGAYCFARVGTAFFDARYLPCFLAGMALLGGGIASFFGDRLWLGSSYRVLSPDTPVHSKASRLASLGSVLSGIACLAFFVGRTFGHL